MFNKNVKKVPEEALRKIVGGVSAVYPVTAGITGSVAAGPGFTSPTPATTKGPVSISIPVSTGIAGNVGISKGHFKHRERDDDDEEGDD